MALTKRSYPLESVQDPAVREILRLLFDRIHDLESRTALRADLNATGHRVIGLGDATADGDAVSRGFADGRYVQR